jgi:hypothetical protein
MRVLEMIRSFPLGLWLGIGGAVIFGVIYVFETRRSGLALIHRWAKLHGYEIISARRRAFSPPGFRQWKGISCFRVFVRDAKAKTKSCWLRFHDLEADPKQVEARWDAKV